MEWKESSDFEKMKHLGAKFPHCSCSSFRSSMHFAPFHHQCNTLLSASLPVQCEVLPSPTTQCSLPISHTMNSAAVPSTCHTLPQQVQLAPDMSTLCGAHNLFPKQCSPQPQTDLPHVFQVETCALDKTIPFIWCMCNWNAKMQKCQNDQCSKARDHQQQQKPLFLFFF